MNYEELLEQLWSQRGVSVRSKLSVVEQKAVDEGMAVLRIYQDDHGTPYPFRPKNYILKPTDAHADLMLSREKARKEDREDYKKHKALDKVRKELLNMSEKAKDDIILSIFYAVSSFGCDGGRSWGPMRQVYDILDFYGIKERERYRCTINP